MDRVFLSPACFSDGRATVSGSERHHLADSLRVRVGDSFLATDGEGHEFLLEAERVDRRELVAIVRDQRVLPVHPGERVTLAIAPPKGSRMETAVEKTVECGVGRIVPLRTEHSVVKADGTERVERWRRVARSAVGQCGRVRLPRIDAVQSLADVLACPGRRLLAHLDENAVPLVAALEDVSADEEIILLVGPEGGFSADEVDEARRAGAIAVSLGSTRLRTETAGIVAVARTVAALDPSA